MTALREAYRYRYFLFNLVWMGLKTRYRFSLLGLAWTIAYPSLHLAILSIVFSAINRWNLADYAIFMFSGFVPWNFFAKAVLDATVSIPGNAHYITKVRTPKLVFPLNATLQALVDFCAGLLVLMVLFVVLRGPMPAAMLFLPIAVVIWVLFAAGVGMILSVVDVVFRDFGHLAGLLFMLLFFSTPILYPADPLLDAGGIRRSLIVWNPMYYFVSLFQRPIHYATLPPLPAVGIAAGLAALSVVLGVALYQRFEDRFVYYL